MHSPEHARLERGKRREQLKRGKRQEEVEEKGGNEFYQDGVDGPIHTHTHTIYFAFSFVFLVTTFSNATVPILCPFVLFTIDHILIYVMCLNNIDIHHPAKDVNVFKNLHQSSKVDYNFEINCKTTRHFYASSSRK